MSEEAKVGLGLYAEGFHAGIEKAKADMRSFEGQTNRSLGATGKSWESLGKTLSNNGYQINRYAGAVGSLTGQFELGGAKASAFGKAIDVLGTAISGGLGPGSLAVAGLVGIAALIASITREQKKLREETEKATDALIDQALQGTGLTRGSGEDLAKRFAEDRKKQAEYEAEINKLERERESLGIFEQSRYGDITREVEKWRAKLWDVNKELANLEKVLDRARRGSKQNPIEIEVKVVSTADRPGRSPKAGATAGTGIGEMMGPPDILAQLRMGSWAQPGFDSPDIARQIAEPHLTANELILESYDRMSVGVQAAYAGMHGTMRGLIQGTSDLVAAAVMGENLERLKGLDIAMYVAGQGAAAALRAIGDVSAKRATEAAALGFLKIAEGTFGLKGAAAGFKAAGLYGILAGGAYGLAAGIEGRTKLEIGRSAEKAGIDSSGSSSTSSSGFSSSGGWGAQVAPTTVTYAPQLIINGNGYFGSDADRELARRLIPMLEQAMALRSN